MKTPAHKTREEWPLPLDEWDFHDIRPEEIKWIVPHEFARECPDEMGFLERAFSSEAYRNFTAAGLARAAAEGSKDKGEIRKWETEWGEYHREANRYFAMMRLVFNPELVRAMETAARLKLDCIKPWMSQRGPDLLRKIKNSNNCLENLHLARVEPYPSCYTGGIGDLFVSRPEGIFDHELARLWQDLDVNRYVVHVDWRLVESARDGMRKLRSQIGEGLARLRPKPTRSGRAAAIPYHLLRGLAALRLERRAGLNFDSARKIVERLADQKRIDLTKEDRQQALPVFTSVQGWKRAIREADSYITKIKQPLLPRDLVEAAATAWLHRRAEKP